MENFILNEIYDLQRQKEFVSDTCKDAYSLYSKLQQRELLLQKSIEELVFKYKLYFPLSYLELYSGLKISNIDLVFEYNGEIRKENIWSCTVNSDGILTSSDESEYEIEYINEDGKITYKHISYEPYGTITIPNVLGFINLEYEGDGKTNKVDYNIPERSYK